MAEFSPAASGTLCLVASPFANCPAIDPCVASLPRRSRPAPPASRRQSRARSSAKSAAAAGVFRARFGEHGGPCRIAALPGCPMPGIAGWPGPATDTDPAADTQDASSAD